MTSCRAPPLPSINRYQTNPRQQSKLLILLEREMGFEPTASSLGIFTSIEYIRIWRSPACMQIQANQQLLSDLPLIGGFLEGAPPSPLVLIEAPSFLRVADIPTKALSPFQYINETAIRRILDRQLRVSLNSCDRYLPIGGGKGCEFLGLGFEPKAKNDPKAIVPVWGCGSEIPEPPFRFPISSRNLPRCATR
jgi:hypothetical protein